MKFDLMLLFALVGSFCAITHAMPTSTAVTEESSQSEVPPAFHSTEAPVQESEAPLVHSEASTEVTWIQLTTTEAPVKESEASTAGTEATHEETEVSSAFTMPYTKETVATELFEKDRVENTETTKLDEDGFFTNKPLEATEAADEEEASLETSVVTELEAEVGHSTETKEEGVEVENSEGIGAGHVVGIVIGALVAVVVIIAVIVVVVRRMGQYTP